MLLACGFLVSCFSVDALAAGNQQTIVPLSGGNVSIYWHSQYNGSGVSYCTFTNDVGYPVTVNSVKCDSNSGKIKAPHLDAIKIEFSDAFHLKARADYLFQLAGMVVKFGYGVGGTMAMYDQYNNTVWTGTSYSPGNDRSQNGFIYYLMRDLPVSLDVKSVYIRFNQSYGYADDVFGVDGIAWRCWMQCIELEKGADGDDVVKAIEDQTAADQSRYDDFTNDGSSQGPGAISGAQESVSGKIGTLDFAEGVLSDFIGLFSATPGDATLTLPGFKWHDSDTGQELTVWEPQTFDFAFVEEHFGPLVSALRVGTVLAVYGAMLWYLQGVFDRIFGRGGDND